MGSRVQSGGYLCWGSMCILVESMYITHSRTISTILLIFYRYDVHGIALLGKDKNDVPQLGDICNSAVSKVLGKGEEHSKALLDAVRKQLQTYKVTTQDKYKPWMYVYCMFLYKFGANFVSRCVIDWLGIPEAKCTAKEVCARKFAE